MLSDEAVEAALSTYLASVDEPYFRAMPLALEAAAPHMLAARVAEAKANNDHIVEGGDGYSSGFHYALQCISPDA